MASFPLCLRCLRRSLRSIDGSSSLSTAQRTAFSTTTSLSAAAAPAKKKPVVGKPAAANRQGRSLRLAKNQRTQTARPPAPGERKTLKKRIVLSNTNALEVEGLKDLTGDKLVRHEPGTVELERYTGQVLGLANETVDALRALEAFKPTQGWSLFRRPASLVRMETADLANDLANAEGEKKETARKVVYGFRGSGKSVLLLQTQAMAFVKGWIVVHYPEAQDLVNAHTSYLPYTASDGTTIYIQPHYTAKLLTNLAKANQELLSTLRLSKKPEGLPIPIQSNISLARFAELGAKDPDLAWPVWQALWSELITPSSADGEGLQRPPVLVSMDGVDQAMRMSAYLNSDAQPIHAHDLALPRHCMDLLSGRTKLPNGGMVIAATCASNRATTPVLDHCLNHAHTAHLNASRAPDAQLRLPAYDPYAPQDTRVEAAMKNVRVTRLLGLSKEEARGMMEYYARSGVFRGSVTDSMVSEKWTLSGMGNIGELERAAVGARF